MANNIKKIAFIGNYLPRRCGIATFTTDLCETFAALNPSVQVFAIPVTDIEEGYDYPERVRFEIKEQDIDSYKAAADFLNFNNIDVVCLQHEFGI
ncbi:MAG: glycosyl transferase family 1, partial [Candidatus Omnitrophica bacterium]|nr:glycosyl transferase family 1 [Candidatus Omnitrophota bacterium]